MNERTQRLDSLEELIESIDMGLDIEFYIFGKRYNISTNEKPFIALCPDGDAIYFDNGEDLVKKYKINGLSLYKQWDEMIIESM